ncbi:MAG: hypothetical protein A2046_04670 [Bacteroidetes bacterium GWA2_30_7]|nr:MAG: hypothetical protein A2046_04670 [Bacteroidetes bacterium GWA2_30_7]
MKKIIFIFIFISNCVFSQTADITIKIASDKAGKYHEKNGNPLYKKRYVDVGDFKNNLAWIKDDDGYFSHIDTTGTQLYKKKYVYVTDFDGEFAVAQDVNDKRFHIRKNGVPLYGKKFFNVRPFSENLAAVQNDNGDWFFIDTLGVMPFSRKFVAVGNFHQGYAWVADDDDGKFYHVSKTGIELYKNHYDGVTDFQDSIAYAKDGQTVIMLFLNQTQKVERFFNLNQFDNQ